MSKNSLYVFGLITIVSFLLFSPKLSYASHQQQVLGDSTSEGATDLSIPPTVDGPGLILPDSPFFFLDKIKQTVRLTLAFTPEARAKVNADVAGERLAELRLMLAKKHKAGIETDLQGISEHLQKAADELSLAQLSGRDISPLAKEINIRIKRKQEALDVLESQAKGEIKIRVKAVQEAILPAKIKVEDALPEVDLKNEIRDTLERKARRRIDEASESAKEIDRELRELQKEATAAAQKSLRRREEALRKAIEKRNETLRKVEERLLEIERKKQEKLLKVQEKAAEEARKAIKKAQEAARGFQEAQDAVNKIRNTNGSDKSDKD